MGYEAFILIPPGNETSIEEIHERMENLFNQNETIKIIDDDQKIIVEIDEWRISISLNSAAHVVEESIEMAEMFGTDREDKAVIATCDSRIEISSDDDNEMEYFNVYIEILEELGGLQGAIVWEGGQQGFMDF